MECTHSIQYYVRHKDEEGLYCIKCNPDEPFKFTTVKGKRAKAIKVTKWMKLKRIFIKYVKCIISWDFSRLRLKETFFGPKIMDTWSNRWAWVRLFNGLVEFKFHLHNCTYNRPWYYGIVIRFRISICGVFKPHLVLCIGPDANTY